MSWRLERARRAGGVGWVLRLRTVATGRRSVSLGLVPEDEARRALAVLLEHDKAGRLGRWLTWFDRDTTAALASLRHEDPAGEVDLHARDWSRVHLRTYWREVYAPWRSRTAASWPGERTGWLRILRELGDVPIGRIDAWTVADYLDGLTIERDGPRKGGAMAGNTKRLHRAAIAALLKRAFRLRSRGRGWPPGGTRRAGRRTGSPSSRIRRRARATAGCRGGVGRCGRLRGVRASSGRSRRTCCGTRSRRWHGGGRCSRRCRSGASAHEHADAR